MRNIAVVGAGQAGLLAAHALKQRGYEVTLHSDKSPEDFLERARPTGVAARFDMALEFERELGLEHWGDQAPRGDGVHLTFCPEVGNQLVTLLGRLSRCSRSGGVGMNADVPSVTQGGASDGIGWL